MNDNTESNRPSRKEKAEHVAEVMTAPPGCVASGCNQAATHDVHRGDGAECDFRCSKHLPSDRAADWVVYRLSDVTEG